MGFFEKLFGSPEARIAKRVLAESQAQVNETYGPIGDLGKAIVQAADRTYRSLVPVLGFSLSGTPSERQILVFYDLLYFFTHLALRASVSGGLSESQIEKLQGYLGPLLTSTAVGAFCDHWPDDLKNRMRDEVYEKLNAAEVDYSECGGLMSRDDPFSRGTLLGRLGTNIADLWEKPLDVAIMTAVVVEGAKACSEMGLDTHVGNLARVIDSVQAFPGA